jgi:hypothetical protein
MTGLLTDPKGNARRVLHAPRDDDSAATAGAFPKPRLAPEGARYAVCALRKPDELAGFDDLHEALAASRVVVGRVYRRSDSALLAWARRLNL